MLANLSPAELDACLAVHKLTRHTRFTIMDPAALRRVLAKVEAEGVAVVDQELVLGLRLISVPVLDRGGRVAAALSVSVPELAAPKTDPRTLPYLAA